MPQGAPTTRLPLIIDAGLIQQLQPLTYLDPTACGLIGIIPGNMTIYIATNGSDTTGDGTFISPWATITKALDYLKDKWIPPGIIVTITLADGTYSLSSSIDVWHPCGSRIIITGTHTYTVSLTSVQSSSGSAGNWSVVCNVSSVANVAVGDYVLITSASGGSYPTTITGCHYVSNVDNGNTRITISLKSLYTSAPSGAVAATVVVCKTILSNTTTRCVGLTSSLGALNNIVLVGDYNGTVEGIRIDSGGILQSVTNCGLSGWYYGIAGWGNGVAQITGICISYCRQTGVGFEGSANSVVQYACITGCNWGFFSNSGNVTVVNGSVIAGNGTGIFSNSAAAVNAYAINCQYNTTGLYANNMAYIYAAASTVANNGTNTSPALNTEGNNNSIICT